MPLEIGKVVDGTVTGITNFGAFIQLPDGDTGLCHISEIADEYVKDVKDYLKESQTVKVKIIEMNGKGKISLSIGKAAPQKKEEVKRDEVNSRPKKNFQKRETRNVSDNSRTDSSRSSNPRSSNPRPSNSRPNFNKSKFGSNNGFKGKRNEGGGFEDMLNQFMKDSDDKLRDMKKNSSNRRSNGFQRKDI